MEVMEVIETMDSELKTERLLMMVEPSLMVRIDDYRFGERIHSRAEAVRRLIESALANEKAEAAVSAATPA